MSTSIPGSIQGINDYFTITKGCKVFLPIDCVLKVVTGTSDRPYNSKDEYDVKQLITNDIEFDCPICLVLIEVGKGVQLGRCHHYCCKYVF